MKGEKSMINLMDLEIITKSDFDDMPFDSGVVVKDFDPTKPFAPPAEGDLLFVTSGDLTINDNVTRMDLGEDVNGIHFPYAELQVVTGKEAATIAFTSLKLGVEDAQMVLGAADIVDSNSVVTRLEYKATDFKNLAFIQHKVGGGYAVAVMPKALSTGGLSFTSKKGGKGTSAVTMTGFRSIEDKETPEIKYYFYPAPTSSNDNDDDQGA